MHHLLTCLRIEMTGEVRNTTNTPQDSSGFSQEDCQAGNKGLAAIRVIILILVVLFLASGVRTIQQGEVGVVLRLGRLVGGAEKVRQPGLLIAWPYPIDEVIRVPVMENREVTIDDYWQPEGSGTSRRSFHPFEQGYCITGDYNVVLLRITVKYQISDAIQYALIIENPEQLLRSAVRTELIRTIGELPVDDIMTERKAELVALVKQRAQEKLDSIDSGLHILAVEINELIPPRSVLPDFQDVQSAFIEKETAVRNAETYYAQTIPGARAEANQYLNDAEAYKVRVLAAANADANRFIELYEEYRQNPEVVMERLLNESLSRAIAQAGNRYVVPDPPSSGRLLIPPDYGQ